jgi:DNA-binding LytR/AlgR family response regulator
MLLTIVGIEDTEIFVSSLPLRFLIGILAWVILLQWYSMLQKTEILENERIETIREEDKPVEVIDRISVKDGARIHIVHLEELHCLQASGDYVTLFTATGQYIKEQTMKYFEIHLPPTFVRIHRSTIINTDYIMRVELFGKETYQVRLKNGQSLRASNAGYKLLKERLSL